MYGIYKITQKSTGMIYIGQSNNIFARWSQHMNAIDNLSFHEAFRKDPLDFTFEIQEITDNGSKENLDKLEKKWITKYDSYNKGFNATRGNGSAKDSKSQMLLVNGSINRLIHEKYLDNVKNQNILIIGNFKFCNTLALYNNITIITDDYDFVCDDAENVIYIRSAGEIMTEINKLQGKGKRFDLGIHNPPYDKGNEIISNALNVCENNIVLMPFNQYKKNELFKHIFELNLVDPKTFKDVAVQNNLCVCRVVSQKIEQSFEDVQILTYEKDFREFYKLNQKIPCKYSYSCANKFFDGLDTTPGINLLKDYWNKHNKCFCITLRAVLDGAHELDGGAFDVLWNVKKSIDWNKLPISVNPKRNNILVTVDFLEFKTEKECENFTKFFYAGGKNGLMTKLTWGLHKSSGSILPAIPQIDWSKDRDYEHLTYEELIKALKEDNNL